MTRALPNGWWGAAAFVATEASLFGALLATYFYLRFQAPAWPPPGIESPDVALPLALTGALVLTTGPMFVAARAAVAGRLRAAWTALAIAGAVQAGYLAVQIVLFADDVAKLSPRDSAYASIYLTLLAVHHAHVLLGILMVAWLLARLLWGLTSYRVTGVRAVALYWYFVAAVGVLVTLTQVSPSL
jgi:cytochrome c oxidase subunit III